MRLAFMYRRLAREGGTEGDLYRTTEALAARGHDVHLFCAELRTPPPRGVSVQRVPVLRAGRLARLLSFAWTAPRVVARAGSWDVVVGFGRTVKQDLARCGGGTHRAYLATMQTFGARRPILGPYHRAILTMEAMQYRPGNFRRVLAVSERVRDEVVADYGVPASRVHVLYNGVDLARFDPGRAQALRPLTRQTLGTVRPRMRGSSSSVETSAWARTGGPRRRRRSAGGSSSRDRKQRWRASTRRRIRWSWRLCKRRSATSFSRRWRRGSPS
jgi:UDP-glucose:(heptosyl)LPS alpha-1,3-glucosyltransferase